MWRVWIDSVGAEGGGFSNRWERGSDDVSVDKSFRHLDEKEGKKVQENLFKREWEFEKFNDGLVTKAFITALIMVFGIIVMLFLKQNFIVRAMAAVMCFCIGIVATAPVLTQIFFRLTGDKETKRFCRLHAAEHAAINAYHDLGRLPTLEEIKKYSIFSYDCRIADKAAKGWFWYGGGILVILPSIWSLIFGIVFLIVSVLGFRVNFYFLQFVSIKKPTDKDYEIALAALSEIQKSQEHVEE